MRRAAITAVLICLAAPVAAHQGGSDEAGIVESVIPGSPAEAAGLRAGDRLIAIDGRTIASRDDLQAALDRHEPGQTVPLAVIRDGEPVDLTLTFGARPDGGVSIGIQINLVQGAGGEGGEGARECLAWIDGTYRIDAMMRSLGLDLDDDYEEARACVVRVTGGMATADAVRYCDNLFKVHCSGIDLLTEVGEAQVDRCAAWLGESLGVPVGQLESWTTCAEGKVFERYVKEGKASDEGACREVLLDGCGVNIDAAIRGAELSPGQREFAECCRAGRLAPDRGAAGGCAMIGDGFTRGPCRDYPVCVNRLNGEWFHCTGAE